MGIAEFVNEQLQVADALASGDCGGDYVDAVMIMAALLSGIASDVWPGTGIDRRRFIELWVSYGRPDAHRVSVPLLTQTLRDQNRTSEAACIEAAHPAEFFWIGSTSVLAGDDVDMSERAIRALCPTISVRDLRQYAYPALFYEHVRCAGVHEYQIGARASVRPMTLRTVGVSYVNQISRPANDIRRHIHFHAPWLRAFIEDLASAVDARPRPAQPNTWWIDGQTT